MLTLKTEGRARRVWYSLTEILMWADTRGEAWCSSSSHRHTLSLKMKLGHMPVSLGLGNGPSHNISLSKVNGACGRVAGWNVASAGEGRDCFWFV